MATSPSFQLLADQFRGGAEQHDASDHGSGFQFAVVTRQGQSAANSQLPIGGVIGGKLVSPGQVDDGRRMPDCRVPHQQ
jgi:hypothetical protein